MSAIAEKRGKKRVLVADDSITIQKLVNLTLADGDFEVITAIDGQDAQLKMKRLKPELMLLDSNIQELSGEQILNEIDNDSDLAGMKVILLQTEGHAQRGQETNSHFIHFVLQKPFDSKTLAKAVQNLLSSRSNETFSPAPAHQNLEKAPEEVRFQVEDDEEPTLIRKELSLETQEEEAPEGIEDSHAPSGPFSSYNREQVEREQKGDAIRDRLSAIAAEVTSHGVEAQTLEEEAPRDLKDFHSNETKEEKIPANLESPDFEKIAREEIKQWIEREMPQIAERLVKEEISRLSQQDS